jgi:preprotein translocase subunit YajC
VTGLAIYLVAVVLWKVLAQPQKKQRQQRQQQHKDKKWQI